ncbi:formiminoglutamase [Winogradskyella wandonensis]|uniref:Formiminoglutamase n=1 Tax=Winogradskyella wandonensis TaxID=1442586 RepID=A0A4R1KYD2_9FLAO|nr:formimidoylglutamase [Winogradskyella wandonensis]TCK69189.1 formiminoglutamase [Winogradskyella wandonensis]
MQNLILFTFNTLKKFTKTRKGETKFGERVQLISNFNNNYEDIAALDVDYVIFGVSEDIGVIANYGNTGAYKAWEATVKVLLNTQNNSFLDASRVLILGHLNYSEALNQLRNENLCKKERIALARKLTEVVDKDVTHLVYSIVKAKKTPIIIGGGHNNAYGNIKGSSLALNKKVNVVNLDAHHDFRALEGRHSGNGFSYAHYEGFLKNYFIFGLHENYISEENLKAVRDTQGIEFNTFEDISIRKQLRFSKELKRAKSHVATTNFGIEIDCDAIENMPSSAMTPSGFSTTKARKFVTTFAKETNATYLHICEAAPDKKNDKKVGKFITYLITDFIKAHANRNN